MWLQALVDELQAIDDEQRPHGLYGLRDVLSQNTPSKRLLPLSKILDGRFPQTHLAKRLGWGNCRAWEDSLCFWNLFKRGLEVHIESYASTKVHHYGDHYVLDKVHGKKMDEGPKFLESAVPKIAKSAKYGGEYGLIKCLLFLAHVPSPNRLAKLIGKTADEAFLTRYGLQLATVDWEDRYGRGFHTGIFAWACLPASDE